MSLDRARTLLGNTVERGRSIHEEQTAVRMALRILKREKPDGDWSRLHIDWPEWYDRDGNLKPNHEELRARKVKPVETPRPPTFHGWTVKQWDDHIRKRTYESQQARERVVRERERENAMRREREKRREEERLREEMVRRAAELRENDRRRASRTPAFDKARRAVNAKPGTIGHMANVLLKQVRMTVNGVNWGYSYAQVIAAIKVKFPKSNPTINTMRWYESKLRTVFGKDAVPRRVNDL